jgi:polysaccharide biosynthesis/export protein
VTFHTQTKLLRKQSTSAGRRQPEALQIHHDANLFGARLFALVAVLAVSIGSVCAGPRPAPQFMPYELPGPSTDVVTTVTITNRVDPAWLQPPTEPFTLGPGDKVEIQLMGEPASRAPTIVAPDGKIYYNLLPGIDVWGLTLSQAKDRMEQAFTRYVREKPQLSLTLRDVASKRIWILGRVQVPGVYSVAAPVTLLEAISDAGGALSRASFQDQHAADVTEDLADLKRSFVVREGKCLPVDFSRLLTEGDLSQNIYLHPDDFIYFPASAARQVYVLGAVTQPQPVPYHVGLTAAAAVASAYGTLHDADLAHVAIVRGSLSRPQMTVFNMRHAVKGQAMDFDLEPGDIVYVPLSPYRYIDHYLQIILDTFTSSVAINAGSRVVGVPNSGAGIFIPIGSGIQVIPPTVPPPIH